MRCDNSAKRRRSLLRSNAHQIMTITDFNNNLAERITAEIAQAMTALISVKLKDQCRQQPGCVKSLGKK